LRILLAGCVQAAPILFRWPLAGWAQHEFLDARVR